MSANNEPDAAPGSGHEPGPEIAAPARFHSLRRQVLSLPVLVSFLVAGGFLLFMVTRFDVDLGVTWEQVRGANPWLLAAAFAVHYTTFIFRGARWRMLLENAANASGGSAPVPGLLFCSRAILLGWFVNSIGWLRLGDAFRAYLYREEYGAPFSGAVGTLLAERVLDIALVGLLLLAAAPFLIGGEDGGGAWLLLTATAGVMVALLLLVVAAMAMAGERLSRWLPGWLASRYQRFQQGTIGSFRRLPQTTLLGLLGWLSEAGRMYLVTMALGFELSPAVVISLTLSNSLLSLVPTPGGIGAVESGVAGLAVRLSSLAKESATALVLVDRFITYVSTIIVGAAVFAASPVFRRRAAPGARAHADPLPEGERTIERN